MWLLVYLMLKTDSTIRVQLVVSKTRVSPMQVLTISRSELLSALLLARLITTVSANLNLILPPFDLKCYTDSRCNFLLDAGNRQGQEAVCNNSRMTDIPSHVPPENWRHCPGLSNPADLPSRGLTLLELSVSQLWRNGPSWLYWQDLDLTQEPCNISIPRECTCMSELRAPKEGSHKLVDHSSSSNGWKHNEV